MSIYAKVAIAAVAVIAVGALGLAVLRPGPGIGNDPSPTPAPDPALTESFVSDLHGISVSYPAGWNVRKATALWTTGIPLFGSEFADVIYDESTEDLKFIGLASQPLAGRSGDQWITETRNDPGWGDTCEPQTEAVTVDGGSGLLIVHCPDDGVLTALVTVADRGYNITLYGVGDMTWFRAVLATARLAPENAVDVAPSAGLTTTEAFQRPFSYVAPEGIDPDPDTLTSDRLVAFLPTGRFVGQPAGVAVVAIGGGRVDPCAETSDPLSLPGGSRAVIDYLKTVPTLEVTDEAAATVGGIAGDSAVIRAGSATTECPDVKLWAWTDTGAFTQNVPRGDAARVTVIDVGGDHIVILSHGGDADPAWDAVADELIASFQFESP